MRSAPNHCSLVWRCLQFGCPRCDREATRQRRSWERTARAFERRNVPDTPEIAQIKQRIRDIEAEQRRILEQAARDARDRRENDPTLN